MLSRRLCTTYCTYCCTKHLQILHDVFLAFPMAPVFYASKISLSFGKLRTTNLFYGIWKKWNKFTNGRRRIMTDGPLYTGQVFPRFVFSGLFLNNMQLLVRLHPVVYIAQSYTQSGCFWSTSNVFFCQQIFLSAFLARVSAVFDPCQTV